MSEPLFIIGVARSGTTWLANMLSNHQEICGNLDERHWGIIESCYFSDIYNYFGDISKKSNFLALCKVLNDSDYFQNLQLPDNFLESLFPVSYDELFRKCMDQYAEKKSAKYWLEKTPRHTAKLNLLSLFFPDAKFIFIFRNILPTIQSQVINFGLLNTTNFIKRLYKLNKLVKKFIINRKLILSSKGKINALTIDYELLLKNRKEVIIKICKFLNIDFSDEILVDKYKKNKELVKHKEINKIRNYEKNIILILNIIYSILPIYLSYKIKKILLSKIKSKFNLQEKLDLPKWFYSQVGT